MAQVKAAKDALLQAITTFKCSKVTVSSALKSRNVNERTLTSKLTKLEEALSALNSAHTTWVTKSEFTDEILSAEAYSNTWLEAMWVEYGDLHDQADELLSINSAEVTPPMHNNGQKLLIYTKQMESLQNDIKQKVYNLAEKSRCDVTTASHKLYLQILDGVSESLGVEYEQLSQNILLFDSVNFIDILQQHDEFRQKYKKELLTIQLQLAEKVPNSSSSVRYGMEMEKSKAPTFSGRTIDYPEFRRGWTKTAGVRWDDDNQVEQIKLKVDDETKRIISRCNSMKEVWEALDLEYAHEQEVVNAVDAELKQLKSMNCSTPEYIVKLRNHLPNLEEALKGVNGLEHLCSPSRVNFMAGKFDERTMFEWEYFRSKSTGTTYDRFFAFLKDRYDASRSTIARLKSVVLNETPITEYHRSTASVHHIESHECRRCKWIARDGVYTCPACGRGTPEGNNISHCVEHCGKYLAMSANEKSNCIEKSNWCPIHLLGSHDLTACNMKNDARFICGVNGCKMHHHKSLHGSTSSFVASIHSTQLVDDESAVSNGANILLLVESVETPTGPITSFYDNGSSCCLITNSAAERLGLIGEPVIIFITTVNGKVSIDSHAYSVTLIDRKGKKHIITAYAIDNISNDIRKIDISEVKGEFSQDVQRIWDSLEDRPHGEIDVLVGMNACGLHPVDVEISGNLKVMSSIFGNGYLLAGAHPLIGSTSIEWNETVSSIRSSHLSFSTQVINKTSISVKPKRDFFETEGLGVEPPRRCGNCMNCKDCSFRGQQLSLREQYEYHVIESKIKYNKIQCNFHVEYPFTEDPSILPNNYRQVVKIAEREEKKLTKYGLLDHFNTEFDKMISHGALMELTFSDTKMWDGAVHYVSLQHVVKEDSPTTPFRIVTNSSLSDKHGVSLNSILMKGPNTLSNQWEILTRWRMYEIALCSDVTKAYYSLPTGEVEKHVRRVVWRYGNLSENWRIFAFRTVSFGDRPAAVILEVVIKRTAELFWSIDPEAAYRIMNDRYVDDFASGGFQDQVSRFIGNEISNFQHDGTLPSILAKGSLQLKVIVASGENNTEKLNKLGNSVLGVGYDPPSDTISIKFNIAITIDNESLTQRTLLSMINGVYDPLGLCAPFTLRLKVAFRNLFGVEPKLGWDDPISPDHHELWWTLIKMMASTKEVVFQRGTRPHNAVGQSQLVCFFDGSDAAFACVQYVRWTLRDSSVAVILMGCKSRVTPLQRISTPRSELNGALLASRLVLSTLRSISLSKEVPERVWMIGDSECTLASLEKISAPFGEYFGNRIGETHDNQSKIEQFCPVGLNGEWWFTDSENNAADVATRLDTDCIDLSKDEWQCGPSYLKLPCEEWPIDRSFAERKDDYIPQNELLKRYRSLVHHVDIAVPQGIDQLIDPYVTNSWDVLVSKTQAMLVWYHQYKYGTAVAAATLSHAKRLWYLSAMKDTCEALEKGKLRELDVKDSDGLKVIVGRAQVGLQKFFGKDSLPVLMGHTRVAYLIMLCAHGKDHCGRDITMATARHEAWIVHANKLAKNITKSCVRCRFLRKSLEGQKMAVLPIELQGCCPPFSNIGVDLCGPYTVKSMTNKRTTMKVWVVILLCLNTKAISMELAPGYSTEDFLLAYTNHVSTHGIPSIVHSDRGSQLVAAKKELCDDPLRYDWDAIAHSTTHQGSTWKFTPAGAQWRNGAAEAFVKKFKLSFHHLYKETKLNYAQLLTAVKRIANILNDRPVSVQRTKTDNNDEDFLSPLTPNMLITGRSASGPPRDFVDVQDPHQSRSFVDELERAWWYQYKVQYFHSLLPTRKWLHSKRNMMIGDIVLIEYSSKSAPGTYRLGRVTKVEVDKDRLVRTCTVLYKLIKPVVEHNKNTVDDVVTKEIRVPVQRLVLILPAEEQS